MSLYADSIDELYRLLGVAGISLDSSMLAVVHAASHTHPDQGDPIMYYLLVMPFV